MFTQIIAQKLMKFQYGFKTDSTAESDNFKFQNNNNEKNKNCLHHLCLILLILVYVVQVKLRKMKEMGPHWNDIAFVLV